MRTTPEVKEPTKIDSKPATDKVELAFDPEKEIKNWNRMPEHIRRFKMKEQGLNEDGTPLNSVSEVSEESNSIKVEGIAKSLTIDKAIELRDALNKAIEEYEEI